MEFAKQSNRIFIGQRITALFFGRGFIGFYGFSLDQGQPLADVAAKYGAGNFQGNVVYIFSNTGAFITTLLYCLYLHAKEKTFGQYTSSGRR